MLIHRNAQSVAAGSALGRSSLRPVGFAILALALSAPATRADLFDAQTITNSTGSSQSQMNLVFSGNIGSAIDAIVNPYGTGGTQSLVYNSMSNTTTVTFSGAAVAAGATASYGLSFSTDSFTILGSYWDTLTNAFPSLSVTASSMSQTGTAYYGLFYTELEFSDGATADMYEELPIPGGCGEFDMSNAYDIPDLGGGTLTTFDSVVGGAWITWPIPLDDLDPTDTPPTPPIFWPVSAPSTVAEGSSFVEDVYVTPCPKPVAAGAALIALAGIVAWKRKMHVA